MICGLLNLSSRYRAELLHVKVKGGQWLMLPWIELGYFYGTKARVSPGCMCKVAWVAMKVKVKWEI